MTFKVIINDHMETTRENSGGDHSDKKFKKLNISS